VQLANEAGGEDNVTVQMILVGAEPQHERPAEPTEVEPTKADLGSSLRPPRTVRLVALVLAAALLAAAAWGGYTLYVHNMHRKVAAPTAMAVHKQPAPAPAATTPAQHAAPSTVAGTAAAVAKPPAGAAASPILLLGDDANHSVQKILEEQGKVVQKLPEDSEQAFSQFPLSVIVDVKAPNPPLDLAMQIHKAMTEKFSTELVELRRMQQSEKKMLKQADGSIVVVGSKPAKLPKPKVLSNTTKKPDAETPPDSDKKK
jgi:hypothetical protein